MSFVYEKKSRQLFDDLLEKFSLISHTVKKTFSCV